MHTCQKTYTDIPFAHRQHLHDGHCSLIHGHNWAFTFAFMCDVLDDNGFVVDFGKLKWLKMWIENQFDHKLVLNMDDPLLDWMEHNLADDISRELGLPFAKLADITVVHNCGAEGLAAYIHKAVNLMLSSPDYVPHDWIDRHVKVKAVTVLEDSKNSATYEA